MTAACNSCVENPLAICLIDLFYYYYLSYPPFQFASSLDQAALIWIQFAWLTWTRSRPISVLYFLCKGRLPEEIIKSNEGAWECLGADWEVWENSANFNWWVSGLPCMALLYMQILPTSFLFANIFSWNAVIEPDEIMFISCTDDETHMAILFVCDRWFLNSSLLSGQSHIQRRMGYRSTRHHHHYTLCKRTHWQWGHEGLLQGSNRQFSSSLPRIGH